MIYCGKLDAVQTYFMNYVMGSKRLSWLRATCRNIWDGTVLHSLLEMSWMRTYSLGEQQHFISADMKIPAMHPDVRLLVYNYRQPDRNDDKCKALMEAQT